MEKKLVIITGASSGIGERAAKDFSALGHPVLMLARRVEKMKALNLPNSLCIKVDVRDKDEFAEAIKEGENKFGKADLLINNAGIMSMSTNSANQNPSEAKAMFDTNVLGIINGMNIVLPDMIKNKTGTIMNVSSVAGKDVIENHTFYCGTKFAVHAITEGMRREAAEHGVRVIIVAPGAVNTDIMSHTTDSKAIAMKTEKDKGKSLETKDISDAMIYAYSRPQHVCVKEIVVVHTKSGSNK